jgi:hypothetical protein
VCTLTSTFHGAKEEIGISASRGSAVPGSTRVAHATVTRDANSEALAPKNEGRVTIDPKTSQ